MKIKKGDTVLVISGKWKGKTGKVLKAFPREMKVLVEGVNIVKKHQKPRKEGEKGQIIEIPKPFPVSKVKLICPNCKKATRVGFEILKTKGEKIKVRICKKCKTKIP
jgi:large subunit ribosomal protein L24